MFARSGSSLTLEPPLSNAFDKSKIPYYNVYFSDTWHMRPTLTLTYGLGWALEMPPVEENGKQAVLVDAADQPVTTLGYLANVKKAALAGNVYNPELGFALVGNTANGLKYPYNPFYGEFSPRVAVAWNPRFDSDSIGGKIFGHDSTVIRGGYGRGYGRTNGVVQVLVPLLGLGLEQPVACNSNLVTGSGLDLRRLGGRHLWNLRDAGLSRRVSGFRYGRPDRSPDLACESRRCPSLPILGSTTRSPRTPRVWIRISGLTRSTRSISPSSVSSAAG